MSIIIITGTPGSGKTTISKKLATLLEYKYLDVNQLIKKKKLSQGYDRKRKCQIIDTKLLNKELVSETKKHSNLIIDSHLSHHLPLKHIDLCLITRCNLRLLKQRLKRRDYSKDKIEENLEVEIMEVIPNEVQQKKYNYFFIDTDKKIDYKKLIRKIKRTIKVCQQ
ncbi:adenylate kinase family protein [Nanoarchaeota archaeon]